jgi:Tol biopolymer transport system component
MDTGEERELIPKLKQIIGGPIGPPQWSPEGDEIVVTGRNEVGHNGAFIVNLEDTSYFSLLDGQQFLGRDFIWSHNNNELYYRINGTMDMNGLYVIDRKSNTHTRILEGDNILELMLHPKENLLAISSIDCKAVELYDVDKQELKELISFGPEVRHITFTWSPDGKWLYIAKYIKKDEVELWRVSKEGKSVQLIDDSFPPLKFLTFHPDGKVLAFTVGEFSGDLSIWVMKNFLDD